MRGSAKEEKFLGHWPAIKKGCRTHAHSVEAAAMACMTLRDISSFSRLVYAFWRPRLRQCWGSRLSGCVPQKPLCEISDCQRLAISKWGVVLLVCAPMVRTRLCEDKISQILMTWPEQSSTRSDISLNVAKWSYRAFLRTPAVLLRNMCCGVVASQDVLRFQPKKCAPSLMCKYGILSTVHFHLRPLH